MFSPNFQATQLAAFSQIMSRYSACFGLPITMTSLYGLSAELERIARVIMTPGLPPGDNHTLKHTQHKPRYLFMLGSFTFSSVCMKSLTEL